MGNLSGHNDSEGIMNPLFTEVSYYLDSYLPHAANLGTHISVLNT